jgi:hypothetical protein
MQLSDTNFLADNGINSDALFISTKEYKKILELDREQLIERINDYDFFENEIDSRIDFNCLEIYTTTDLRAVAIELLDKEACELDLIGEFFPENSDDEFFFG